MSNTTRLNLRAPEGGDPFVPAQDISINAEALDNAAIDLTGTAGSRPTAASVARGTYYFANDTGELSRSDGTNWFTVTPGSRTAFDAQVVGTGQGFSTGTTTKADLTVENYDLGGDFDAASSRFAAPVNGVYEFNFEIMFSGTWTPNGTRFIGAYLYKNGAQMGKVADLDYGYSGYPGGANTSRLRFTRRVKLDASDYVEFFINNQTGSLIASNNGASTIANGILVAQLP
jgi:hypothetical protein